MKKFTVYDEATGRILWSGSCPDADFDLQSGGVAGAVVVEGQYDGAAGYFLSGVFVAFPPKPSDWAVWDWDGKGWVLDTAGASAAARGKRDRLLAASDYTQLPDIADAVREAWLPYRQALRDVPEQAGFPLSIVWPTAPA